MFDYQSSELDTMMREERAMASVKVIDETTAGERTEGLTLQFLTERVTVRELIRSRVYQEVTEHNARRRLGRRLLVPLGAEERALNGDRSATGKRVDWEQQYGRALSAFEGNGFLLFVDGAQLMDLDEEIELRHDTEVTFLRLVSLVGG